jgi:hypothetical protein
LKLGQYVSLHIEYVTIHGVKVTVIGMCSASHSLFETNSRGIQITLFWSSVHVLLVTVTFDNIHSLTVHLDIIKVLLPGDVYGVPK